MIRLGWQSFPVWLDPDVERYFGNVFRVGCVILHGFVKYTRKCGLWPGVSPSDCRHDLNLGYQVLDTVLCLHRLIEHWESYPAEDFVVEEWAEQLAILKWISRKLDTHFPVGRIIQNGLQNVSAGENTLSIRFQH